MKRIYLFLISLFFILGLSSCKNESLTVDFCIESTSNLFNSESLSFRADLETKDSNMDLKLKLFEFTRNKNQAVIDFSETSIITSNLMFYIEDDPKDSDKINISLGDKIEGIKTKIPKTNNTSFDFASNIKNTNIENNAFIFELDLKLDSIFNEVVNQDENNTLKFEVIFANKEIAQISCLLPISNDGLNTYLVFSEISTNDNDFHIPYIAYSYDLTNKDNFNAMILEILDKINKPETNPTPDPTPEEITYHLVLEQEYKIGVWEDNINAYGKIIGSDNSNVYCELELYSDIPFHKPGKYEALFRCYFQGEYYENYALVNIIDSTVQLKNFEISLDKIENTFYLDNYMYITTSDKLYRYNLLTKELDANSINLKCQANRVVPYQNYLYVLANYDYSSEYLDEYAYSGTITKIDFESFTMLDQMDVNYYPYDIEFENEDILYVSKGLNQHVNLEIVNLKEKTSKKFLTSYAKDKLLYDKENKIFYINGNNCSKYVYDPTTDSYKGVNNSIFDDIYSYLRTSNYIFSDNGYYDISNLNAIKFKRIDFSDNYIYSNSIDIAYDNINNTVYYLYKNEGVHNYRIVSYNLDTENMETDYITTQSDSYSSIGAYNGVVYIYNNNTMSFDYFNI